jgi:hypothetical protein
LKARQLIETASFGPDALKIVYQAFDEAWQSIEGNFGPGSAETARVRLAKAILDAAAQEPPRDAEALKRAGLQNMAMIYRAKPAS